MVQTSLDVVFTTSKMTSKFLLKIMSLRSFLCICLALCFGGQALQVPRSTTTSSRQSNHHVDALVNRRSILSRAVVVTSLVVPGGLLTSTSFPVDNVAHAAELTFSTSASGIQWADAKLGNGTPKQLGDVTAVDYVLSTTGARYGSKIYSTQGDTTTAGSSGNFAVGAPYRWKLGDGSTIVGLEKAIVGESGMPPMLPGGVRRVILPSSVAYASLAQPNAECGGGSSVGPVPPPSTAFEEYQRFKNIYCNPNRVYQPDVVMDIKLYGRRTTAAVDQ